jgi:hypothetical protein
MDIDKIINKIKVMHPNLDVLEFKNSRHVKIKDEFGECIIQLHSLLIGSIPTITSAVDKTTYFSNKLKKYHPDITLLSPYKGSLHKVRISTKYGECNCIATSLLRGKPISIDVAVNKTEYYIKQANEKHNNRYDYSKLNYVNASSKITIICKKHGEFNQDAKNHLKGGCCPKCNNEDKSGGWYNNHKNLQKPSSMYILNLKNKDENFMKFGVTTDLNKRIDSIKRSSKNSYNITVVKIITGTVDYCSKLEYRFRRIIDSFNLKYTKYNPKVEFQGKHECFIINEHHLKND